MSHALPHIWHDLPISEETRAWLAPRAKLIGPGNVLSRPDPFLGVEDADAVLTSSVLRWDEAIYQRTPRLKVVARPGMGVDNIVLVDATRYGVAVVNAPDGPTESTAQFTIALMMALVRRIPRANHKVKAGQWGRSPDLIGVELREKTLGVVGLGRIGSRVVEMARALGMHVIGYDPYVTSTHCQQLGITLADSLEALLAQADVVTLHPPLTPETRKMMNRQRFGLMKQGAYLINCGRGGLVDEEALVEALHAGQLAGVALDVMQQEPPPADHPLLQMGDEVLLAPHIASYTVDGVRKMEQGAVEGIMDVLAGKRPKNLVNAEVWSHVKQG